MLKRRHHGASAPAQSFWLRGLAIACLLLVTLTGTAQAVHIHGDWLPHSRAEVSTAPDASQTPGGEEHCPLCMAMHLAMPMSARVSPAELVLVACSLPALQDRLPNSQFHFANFSRPPPAV